MKLTAPFFDEAEVEAVARCLRSQWVTQGPFVQEFESLVARRHGVKHALATTSCTAALHLAALALELGPSDEVIVPAFTWVTSAHCAEYVGAKVVFVDIEPDTFNIDPKALANALTPRTRAVVIVHLFGLAARMDNLLAIAGRHRLKVIEDCACAIGTEYDGHPVGGMGDVGCFSFHPRKVVTTGEGGMVVSNQTGLAERVMALRNHGATPYVVPVNSTPQPYHMGHFDDLGYNLRMSDIQAAVGVAQMAKLDRLLQDRLSCAHRYGELLSHSSSLALPYLPEKCGHTYQSYVVRVREGGMSRRNMIMEYLSAHDIQTRPGTHAVHRLGYYVRKYGIRPEEFPNACIAEDTSITLPIFPGMRAEDQERVVDTLKAALSLGC